MRLHGLDFARYLAFCGMVLVNFRLAAQVTPQAGWPSVLTTALEGRAAALFVVLAGIGVTLARTQLGLILRRALFLFAIGMANLTIFEADILHFYALYFLVAAPFVRAPDRTLWLGIFGALAISLITMVALNYEANWNWDTLYYDNFWTVGGFLRHSFLNGWHPVFPWIAFLFFGMWLGRLDLTLPGVQRGLVFWGTLAAVLAVLPARLIGDPELTDLINTTSIPPGPFYVLAGSGSAAAVIGLVLIAEPLLSRLRLATWLAAPGRQSLTLYVLHILLGMGMLESMGLLDGSLTPSEIFWISLIFCAFCAIYARLWSLVFKRGPLEALMRAVTEFKR